MNKIKLCKSALKINQNNIEVAQNFTFVPLLDFRDGQLSIVLEGLSVLQDQCWGKTYLVGYEGVSSNLLFSLYRNNSILNHEPTHSGVWISNYPRVDPQTGDQYLYLQIVGLSNDDKAKLHVICSLLCSCLLINLEEIHVLTYLTAVEGRVAYSEHEKDQNKNKISRKREMAYLILLQRSKGRGVVMKRDESEIYDILNKSKIYDQCLDLYGGISLLQVSMDGGDLQNVDAFEQQIKDTTNRTFSKVFQLTNGVILGCYLQQLVASVNQVGMIDIDKCHKSIQISQGYHAFQKATQFYHAQLNSNLKDEGIRDMKNLLLKYREQTIEEFKKYSTDGIYLLRLGEYIDEKQQRLIEQNNKTCEISNINYLKNESKTLLDRISKEKINQEQARRLIGKMVSDYKDQSKGDNQFELLTDYLIILEPIVYKTIADRQNKDIKKESQQSKREKLELQNRNTELQENLRREREKSSKCCEII